MTRGSCLCGGVRFEADEIAMIVHCHCSMCRKALGAAFGSFSHVEHDKFRYVAGFDLVTSYESSPGNPRGFCRVCGSSVPVPQRERPSVVIPSGTLDDDPGVRPVIHIYTASKAPWWEIDDALPQFDELPPGMAPPGTN